MGTRNFGLGSRDMAWAGNIALKRKRQVENRGSGRRLTPLRSLFSWPILSMIYSTAKNLIYKWC
jgi:hypothetical protein